MKEKNRKRKTRLRRIEEEEKVKEACGGRGCDGMRQKESRKKNYKGSMRKKRLRYSEEEE